MNNLIGKTVKILKGDGLMSEIFVGSTGKVIGKCGLYKGAFKVQVNGFVISYYPNEIEVIN